MLEAYEREVAPLLESEQCSKGMYVDYDIFWDVFFGFAGCDLLLEVVVWCCLVFQHVV